MIHTDIHFDILGVRNNLDKKVHIGMDSQLPKVNLETPWWFQRVRNYNC